MGESSDDGAEPPIRASRRPAFGRGGDRLLYCARRRRHGFLKEPTRMQQIVARQGRQEVRPPSRFEPISGGACRITRRAVTDGETHEHH